MTTIKTSRWLGWAALCALAACSSSTRDGAPPTPPAPGSAAAVASSDATVTANTPTPVEPDPTPDAAPPPDAPPPAPAGKSFAAEAKLLYRVAACGGSEALPDAIDAKVVERHCKWIADKAAKFRAEYFEGGRAFFDSIVPADAPTTVVYPFGGGDLISALVAFPKATDITTISLELAGDPRRIDTLDKRHLADSLSSLRAEIGGLLSVGSNTSVNLSAGQRNDLPAQVSSFLMGLAAGGYEPVDMRYFKLEADGSIHYYEQAEIDAIEAAETRAVKRKGDWQSPSFSEAFANVELTYRKIGETQLRVHRHFGWNLGDDYLKSHDELLKFLDAKGKVTILTKGGSYMLWRSDFHLIRDYMLSHLAWMLSDSTGIPPSYARKAGMVQDTYGRYDGAFLEGAEQGLTGLSNEFRALWRKNPYRKLPFRFGYVDMNKQAHLVVTRPQ